MLITALTIAIVLGRSHSNKSSSSQMNDLKYDSQVPIGSIDLSPFSYEMFHQVSKITDEPNILISPFSIASALALVLAGTTPNSACQSQIQSVLSVGSHSQIPSLSQQIMQLSNDGEKAVDLTSANGLWVKESILGPYLQVVRDVHDSEVAPIPDTFDPIDAYISEKTNGMIKDTLQGPIDDLTRAILINAVYFKGSWKDKFDEHLTEEGIFQTNTGENRKAMFMQYEKSIEIATDVKALGGASVVNIEYGREGAFSALFFLPHEKTSESLSNVFSQLANMGKPESFSKISLKDVLEKNMSETKVKLVLPRFRISYGTTSLKSQLKSMGMHEAFDGSKGFLQMSEDPDLHLDDVLHKAVIEVTEEGTVASAATAVMMMTRSIPQPPEEMIFNRPFAMVVLHNPSMTPLFIARVDDPEFI